MLYNVAWSFSCTFQQAHSSLLIVLCISKLSGLFLVWMQTREPVKTKYCLYCCKMRHVRVTLGLRYTVCALHANNNLSRPSQLIAIVCKGSSLELQHGEQQGTTTFYQNSLCFNCVTAHATAKRHCLDGRAADATVYTALACINRER